MLPYQANEHFDMAAFTIILSHTNNFFFSCNFKLYCHRLIICLQFPGHLRGNMQCNGSERIQSIPQIFIIFSLEFKVIFPIEKILDSTFSICNTDNCSTAATKSFSLSTSFFCPSESASYNFNYVWT